MFELTRKVLSGTVLAAITGGVLLWGLSPGMTLKREYESYNGKPAGSEHTLQAITVPAYANVQGVTALEACTLQDGIIPDGRRKSADSQSSKTLSEDVLQAIREGKNDAEILTKFPTVWNRSAELRKIRFAIMSQKYRPIYRDLNCIYVEANFPPKEAYKLFAHTPDTYVVSDYTHPWDSYCAEKTVVLTEYVGQFPWFEIRRLLSGNYCTLPARFSDAVACYTNIIIISPLRFAEMCKCGKGYNPNILISYFTHSRRYLDLADFGTDYVLNPTSGDWEQRYLLPPHVEPKKENDHDESEQQ